MCKNVGLIKNPKGGAVQIRCGKCRECLIADVKEWSFRLQCELKYASNAYFVTLTYESAPPDLSKTDIRAFLSDLRHFQRKRRDNQVKPKLIYLIAGEYGNLTNRPHYHMILMNYLVKNTRNEKIEVLRDLTDIWGKGIVHIGNVTTASINYVCKYIFKKFHYEGELKPFRLMSNGIGDSYINSMKDYHLKTESARAKLHGKEFNLPRYMKRKIFDQDKIDKIHQELKRKSNKEFFDICKTAPDTINHIINVWELDKQMNVKHNINQNEKRTI